MKLQTFNPRSRFIQCLFCQSQPIHDNQGVIDVCCFDNVVYLTSIGYKEVPELAQIGEEE